MSKMQEKEQSRASRDVREVASQACSTRTGSPWSGLYSGVIMGSGSGVGTTAPEQ